ncbi:MAG: P-type conjugative transfer protein TrbL [Cardiobacteriaceae bacterium]|nr:P-type conjugative transfer protein TrbL [Cardiobacteriaceae bacterium]
MCPPLFSKRAALALGLVLLMLLPLSSFAQEAEVIRTITNNFEQISNGWHDKLRPAVLYVFWALAAISWAYTGITLALKGADMPELMSELVKIILITGFWLYVIENSVEICNAIINSLAKAAGIAGGAGATGVAPGDIINHGLELANAVIEQGGFFDALIYGILALFILIAYFFIAGVLFVVMVESYIVSGAGIILLGFGGSPWTSDVAKKYLIFALSIGLKLFVTLLVIFFGEALVRGQLNAQSEIKQIFAIAGIIALIAYLTNRLPTMAQSLISGASSSGPADVRGTAAVAGRAAAAGIIAALGTGAALHAAHRSARDSTSGESNPTLAAAAAVGIPAMMAMNPAASTAANPTSDGGGTAAGSSANRTNGGSRAATSSGPSTARADQKGDAGQAGKTGTPDADKEAGAETSAGAATTVEAAGVMAEMAGSAAAADDATVQAASGGKPGRMARARAYMQAFASAYAQGVAGVAGDRMRNPQSRRYASPFDVGAKIREQSLSQKIDKLDE